MITKNIGKELFAIFKKDVHMGNSYGFDELDSLKTYLKKANFPNDTDTLNEYTVVKAIHNVHFFKSEFIKML